MSSREAFDEEAVLGRRGTAKLSPFIDGLSQITISRATVRKVQSRALGAGQYDSGAIANTLGRWNSPKDTGANSSLVTTDDACKRRKSRVE